MSLSKALESSDQHTFYTTYCCRDKVDHLRLAQAVIGGGATGSREQILAAIGELPTGSQSKS